MNAPSMNPRLILKRFLAWRLKRLPEKQFILILSVLVGLTSGLAAVVIKTLVRFIESWQEAGWVKAAHDYLYFVFPLVGILITLLLIRYIVRHRVFPGIPATLYAISRLKGRIPRHNTWSSILGSAFTIGFGGSAGLEGPTVATTAAIGSGIGSAARMNYKTKTLLIGCAAAGSIAAIFQAPVAAIVFAVEVIMLDLTMGSMVPLLLASVTATLTSTVFLPEGTLNTIEIAGNVSLSQVPFYVVLGIICGLFSLVFTKVFNTTNRILAKVSNPFGKAVAGGLILGGLLFLFPALYGEGYNGINAFMGYRGAVVEENPLFNLFDSDNFYLVAAFLLLLVFFKAISTAITTGIGGVGGIFAPTLFMGSALGYLFGRTAHFLGFRDVPVNHFTLVGMAGLMAGILHAPLTAIFLIAEITGGYELFVPLMLTAAIAYATIKIFSQHSVYTAQLAERGELITHDKDKAVLTLMSLEAEIERNLDPVNAEMTLRELVKIISHSKRNLFPVLNDEGNLIGILPLDHVREIMFDQERYDDTRVYDLMTQPPAVVQIKDSMASVMAKFEETEAWNLPVVNDGKYVGVLSKSRLFSAYRTRLREVTPD